MPTGKRAFHPPEHAPLPRDMRYLQAGVPREVPAERVLVHNLVGHNVGTAVGVRGFHAWTEPSPAGPHLIECDCGWAGLLHYRVKPPVSSSS